MQLTATAPLCVNFMHLMHIKFENEHILVRDID